MESETLYRIVELGSFILALAAILYKLGRMTERFELIAVQQAVEIGELKKGVAAIHDVILSQALTAQRMDTIDERVLSEGKRLDKLTDKFDLIDKIVSSHAFRAG